MKWTLWLMLLRCGQAATLQLSMLKTPMCRERLEIFPRRTVADMITMISAFVSLLAFRFRSRAGLELELVALRHQVAVLRRRRKGRIQLFSTDRLLWVWLYRIWPQTLNANGVGEASNRRRVASQGISAVLALAIKGPRSGTAEDVLRHPRFDSSDVPRQSALGRAPRPWRTAQARH